MSSTSNSRKMEIKGEAAYFLNGNVQFTLNLLISATSKTSVMIVIALFINDLDITNGGITRRILSYRPHGRTKTPLSLGSH